MTYKINGIELPKQPVTKIYRRDSRGTRLDGSQENGGWTIQLNFELMAVSDATMVGEYFVSGTPIVAELVNPTTGEFEAVTGVNIANWDFTPSTLDSDFGSLSISLANVFFG